MIPYVSTAGVLLVISALLTAIILRRSSQVGRIDIPNERSSHSTPTPRGGGLSFVIASLAGIAAYGISSDLPSRPLWGLIVAGALVAVVGFLDDRGITISAGLRLFVHGIAALWGLIFVGWLNPVIVFGAEINLSIVGNVIAIIYVVWLLNLFNFMDGIDGIAAVQTISACVGVAVLSYQQDLSLHSTVPPILLAGSVLGFLAFNFPPARIFMGDVGSGFLGIVLALMSLISTNDDSRFFWVWVIMLGVFIVDATITLIRRILRGERPHVAHRSHAYQRVAMRTESHRRVTLGVLFITVAWLLPFAYLVATDRIDGTIGAILAYLPLIAIAIVSGAGKPETNLAN